MATTKKKAAKKAAAKPKVRVKAAPKPQPKTKTVYAVQNMVSQSYLGRNVDSRLEWFANPEDDKIFHYTTQEYAEKVIKGMKAEHLQVVELEMDEADFDEENMQDEDEE